jgi:hypothetical protein
MKQLHMISRKNIYLQIILKIKRAMKIQIRLQLIIVGQKSLNNIQLEQKPQQKILQLMLV